MSIDPRKLPDMPSLMIAGPGELHDEELEVLGSQVIAHYGDVWTGLHNDAVAAIGELVGAADAPYVMPGTGTTCLDAAVFNVFEPGQRVVVVNTGFFGNRLMEIARQHRLEATEVPVEVGAPADPARVADVVNGAHGVLVCHVDGIASVGGDVVDVDGMGLGALVTGSQKGLEAPPGLGVLALGERGRERVEARSSRPESWYLDLKVWDWYRKEWGAWHPHPVTFPSNLLLPLYASVRRILEVGVNEWVERRADLAKRCREGLRSLGLEPVPQAGAEANLVVAAWADDPTSIQKHLLANAGIMISGGLDPTAGKAIRVGLMGATATPEMVDKVVAGVEAALAGR